MSHPDRDSSRRHPLVPAALGPIDAAVHLAVPVAMIVVYLTLPYERLVYLPGAWSLELAYASLFGHADVAHLLGNAVGFLVLSGAGLVVMSALGRRRTYYGWFLTLFVLVPLLAVLQWELRWALTAQPSPTPGGSGFSILTSAFLGLVTWALTCLLHSNRRGTLTRVASPPPTVASIAGLLSVVATGIGVGLGWPAAAVALPGLLTVAFVWSLARAARETLATGGWDARRTVALLVVGVAVLGGSSVDLFVIAPERAVRPHLVGVGLGWLLCAVVIGLERVGSSRNGPGR